MWQIPIYGYLFRAKLVSSLLHSINIIVFFHHFVGCHTVSRLHCTVLQSKISNLPVGGVLVICSSSSNIIINVAVVDDLELEMTTIGHLNYMLQRTYLNVHKLTFSMH